MKLFKILKPFFFLHFWCLRFWARFQIQICGDRWNALPGRFLEENAQHGLNYSQCHQVHMYPLVMTNIAMGNGPFIDGLPLKNGGSFHGELLNNQRAHHLPMADPD